MQFLHIHAVVLLIASGASAMLNDAPSNISRGVPDDKVVYVDPESSGEPDSSQSEDVADGHPAEGGTKTEALVANGQGTSSWAAWLKEHFWHIAIPMYLVAAISPTVWKAATTDGSVTSSRSLRTPLPNEKQLEEGKVGLFFGTWEQVGHTSLGVAGGASLFMIDWDWVTEKCCKGACQRVWAAVLQGAHLIGMLLANLGYTTYNMNKRLKAAGNGHYTNDGFAKLDADGKVIEIYDDSSYFENHTDWVIGLSISVILCLVLRFILQRCGRCSGPQPRDYSSRCSATWIRQKFHKGIIVFIIVVLTGFSVFAINKGEVTGDNMADPRTAEPTLLPTEDPSGLSL